MKFLFLLSGFFFLCVRSFPQSCFPDNADTTIILNCSENCTTLRFTIPDLKQSSAYKVLDIPYAPLPFTDSRAATVDFNGVWPGNSYSPLYTPGFDFCFFNSVYSSLAIGSNGTVTFDASMANGWCDPFLKRGAATFPLPNTRYPGALIAAVMHDLDPGDTARVSTNRKIELRVEGDPPCRKAIISFYQVPLWPGPQRNCQTRLNTHQIILYESTGIIDVFVKDSPQCPGSNEGYNTLAIQNFDRTVAYSARNKNCTQWGGSDLNLGYRFLPSGGNSLLLSANLYINNRNMGIGVITPGPVDGELTVTFPNICPGSGNNTCVLRAVYNSCSSVGIELQDTIYVIKTNSLSATASSQPAMCTSATGSIRVDVPPGLGIPPFQYSLNGGPWQTSNTFTNLAAGNYSVIVRDVTICSDTVDVTVGSLSTLNVSLTVNNTSCNGASDGTIRVDPGGGLAPIQYAINGNPPQASAIFTNLAPGTHTITVTDAAGCISSNNNATVLAGPPLFTTYTKRDISCFGNTDGMITVDPPTAGSPPYTYSIDGVNYSTANVYTNLAAGNYQVRFRDASGCSGELFVFIAEPPLLRATASPAPALCQGQNNGTITAQPTGGTPGYEYSLDGVNYQASSIFNVVAGTYTITTRDRNGCTASVSGIVVTEPSALTATAVSANATCDGGNDGTITITAGGGSPGYQYSVDGANFQASNVFNLAPGFYNVSVKDVNGCVITKPGITVGLTNNLTLTPAADETICEGTSVQLQTISNATQYAWSPATGLDNPAIVNPSASPTITTQYIVTATLGRCSAEDTLVVNIQPAPVPDAGADVTICVGQSSQLQGTGGVSYQWSPATYLDNPAIANPVSTPDKTITYSLDVTGANGCRSQPGRVTVNVTPPIQVTTFPTDTIVSAGDQFGVLAISAATNYSWSPSAGLSNPSVADPVVTAGAAGDLVIYKVIATTAAGCRGEGYVKVQVYKGPDLYVPTGFTPNNDGKNDKFFPIPIGIKELKYFRVYNRWGQLVFSTSRMNNGWDGTFGGKEETTGVYVWVVQGITKDNRVITKRGTVSLIR